jgi:hypothetical protein
MLCKDKAKGLVRLNVLQADFPTTKNVPMCEPCADALGIALERGRRPALTPDGHVYLDDLRELLGRRNA